MPNRLADNRTHGKEHAQDLGKENIVECPEGNVRGRRVETRASTHRRWWPIWQEQGAALPRHESQWTCTNLGGGRWLSAVGIKLHDPLPRRKVWYRHIGTFGPAYPSACQSMDGLAAIGARPCPHACVLGVDPNACRTARPQ